MQEMYVKVQKEVKDSGPSMMNAFELISLSQGLNLSALFDRRQVSSQVFYNLLYFFQSEVDFQNLRSCWS
jgi:hypothetical protein